MSQVENKAKSTKVPSPAWHLYLIRNKLNQLYCGITTDVARRFLEHSSSSKKGAKALKGKAPLTLEFQIEIGTKSDASRLEAKVKKLKKIQKEELIIRQIKTSVNLSQFLDCHLCKS